MGAKMKIAAVAGVAVVGLAHGHGSLPSVAALAASPGTGGNVALGQQMAAARGWTGPQWTCLDDLWTRESGWDTYATYPSHDTPPSAPSSSITTAYGIPQALPAQKMAAAGPDWQTSPATQIRWGLGYIRDTYGTPCGAWSHEEAQSWY